MQFQWNFVGRSACSDGLLMIKVGIITNLVKIKNHRRHTSKHPPQTTFICSQQCSHEKVLPKSGAGTPLIFPIYG